MRALGYTSTMEPIIGYRCWRVMPFQSLDGSRSYRLCAVGLYGVPKVWEPRIPTRALCSDFGSHHEAPWPDHQCGLWALRDEQIADDRMVEYMKSQGGGPVGYAFGPVSLWGRVIEHEHGYRAQFAYPYALRLDTLEEEAARVIRREYAVDVDWAGGDRFERALERRKKLDAAERAAKQLDAELDEMQERLKEIDQELTRSTAAPKTVEDWPISQWSVMSDIQYGDGSRAKLLAYLEDALEAQEGKPIWSHQLARHILDANGFGDAPVGKHSSTAAIGLKQAMYAREVVQLKRKGFRGAYWTLPGKPIPDGFMLFECPHAQKDDAVLERCKALAAARPAQPLMTRQLVSPDAGRSERTLVGQSLGRLELRGVIRESRSTGSHPNEWELVDK